MKPTRATTRDGVSVALHDLGGNGPDALLMHAAGFHGRVLGPLAQGLSGRLHCVAPDLRGHGESGISHEVNFDWSGFALDVLAAVDALGLHRPLGVGHSCGASALLFAEEARPGTFSSLYCFEPILLPLDAVPSPSPGEPLAIRARQRRETFASRKDAYANYASKPPLDTLAPEVLAAYVEFGFDELPDGSVRLRCLGDNEARIYEHVPCDPGLSRLASVSCPVVVACGAQSQTLSPAAAELLAGCLVKGSVEVLPGMGHFGPLEQPGVVAASVLRSLDPPPA